MKQKVKIRQYAPFNRWVVLKADDLSLGWSGSQWVPLYGNVQVSNFDTDFDAIMYALDCGFEPEVDDPGLQAMADGAYL